MMVGTLAESRLRQWFDASSPRDLSQQELDEYMSRLVREGLEDTAEFRRAYRVWEENG